MPSFLSLCLALLRLAIRTTNRVQGLLIDLHNTVEWVIEQQGDPSRIPSTGEQSSSRSLTLPPSEDARHAAPSDHGTRSKSLEISTATSSNREVSKSHRVPSTFYNNADKSGYPPVPEDEPTTEPVQSGLSKRAYDKLDSDHHLSTDTSGTIRQSNQPYVVLQSTISQTDADAEDSQVLKDEESKRREYGMMLKWYRNEPKEDDLCPEEADELEPLDLSNKSENLEADELEPLDFSNKSENLGDSIDLEESSNVPHSNLVPNQLKPTKEDEDTSTPILSKSTPCKLTSTEMDNAAISSRLTTSSTPITDSKVQSSIHIPVASQASTESGKSKDLKHKRRKSKKASSPHSPESGRSRISVRSGVSKTDLALELKAQPESFITHEPWLVRHKSTYEIDPKFEKNLHLKEYDTSTIREKGTSKNTISPIRDSLTKNIKNKHGIESTKKTQSPVHRHSSADRKKSSSTPVKTHIPTTSPSAVALSQPLSLPRFRVDSSTGNVHWKSDMPRRRDSSESKPKSPYKQSTKSTITYDKASLESGTISEVGIHKHNIQTKKMESNETRIVSEPNYENSPTETSTSEEEFRYKPTRERRPTPPPANFPYVKSSTDSENTDSTRSLSFVTEPVKISNVESEFKPVRERRPTPAAQFVHHESMPVSDNKKDEKSKLSVSRETLKFKEKSPLKSHQKSILTTEVGFIKQSSSRRNITCDNHPEQFFPPRNQSIGMSERGEFTFKPTRERRPTPAARFPTPESTDSETAGGHHTQPQHSPQSINREECAGNVEPNPTCAGILSSAAGIVIGGSPTAIDNVSPLPKIASRRRRRSSTSPRSSGTTLVKAKTPPTVGFQVPESQTKRENTGTIRKESKLPLPKSTKEMSTSEEEYYSKRSSKRKASPAKYPSFKSAKMLTEATSASRSLKFSPSKMSSEKKVNTQPLCEGSTAAGRVPIFKQASKNETTNLNSAPGTSLLRELLMQSDVGDSEPESTRFPYRVDLPGNMEGSQTCENRSNNRTNNDKIDSYSTEFEGDSAPEGQVYPHPPTKAPHNSPNKYKDDPSPEMSVSESTTGTTTTSDGQEDSVLEGETDTYLPPPDSNESSDTRERILRKCGIRFEFQLSGSPSSESSKEPSIGYGSAGDSVPEGTAEIVSQSTPEFPNIVENVDASGKDFASISTDRTSASGGSKNYPVSERTYLCPQPETESSKSLTNTENIDDNVEIDSTSSSTETSSSNMYAEDSAPEGTSGLFPQLEAIQSPIIISNADDSSGSNSTSKSTCSEKSASDSPSDDSASENSKSVTNADNVFDSNTVLDSSNFSPAVMASRHVSVDDASEGTEAFSPQPKTIEFPVNAVRNINELSTETYSILKEFANETQFDDVSRGYFASEEACAQKATNESSSKTLSENDTRLEANSASSESLKGNETGFDSTPEATETFLKSPTKESKINVENSRNTSLEIDSISSDKNISKISSSEKPVGDKSVPEKASNICTFLKISRLSDSAEISTDKLGAETNVSPSQSISSNRFINISEGKFECIGDSCVYSQPEIKELQKHSEDSDDSSSETDSTLSESTLHEKSSSDESGDYSATKGAPYPCPDPEMSQTPTNVGEEYKDEIDTGKDSTSGFPQDTLKSERSKNYSVAEELAARRSPLETCESFSANYPDVRTEFEQAYLVMDSDGFNSPEILPSVDADSNSPEILLPSVDADSNSPEILLPSADADSNSIEALPSADADSNSIEALPSADADSNSIEALASADADVNPPERLSPIYEVSTNGNVSDVSYSASENGYSISSPSESSSEDEGEFILQQENSYSMISLSPKNGDSFSEPEVAYRQEAAGGYEYSDSVEPLAVSSPWPRLPICQSPENEKETVKTSESDTMSSLSSPSKSSNTEEEGNNVDIKIEATSEPNFNKSETCDVLILSPESKNIEEDKNGKGCLLTNECLEVTDCGADVASLLFETVQRLTDCNILKQECLSQAQSQILDTDFNSNSVAESSVISHSEEKALCNVSVDSSSIDETKVSQSTQARSFISEASTSIEIENSLSEDSTELSPTFVPEKEICSSILAPGDSSAQQESLEIELDNCIDVLQAEVCSIRESVITTEKVTEYVSSECENNSLTKELTTSQLLVGHISILDSEMDAENRELAISVETVKPLIVQRVTHETCVNVENNNHQISQSPPNTPKSVSSIIKSESENDPVISNLIDEVSESPETCTGESVTTVSIGTKHDEKFVSNNQSEIENTTVLFQSLMDNSKHNEPTAIDASLEASESRICLNANDHLPIEFSNEIDTEFLPKDVSSKEDGSPTYVYPHETQSVDCEVPLLEDNTEMDISVVSESLVCEERSHGSLTKLDDGLDVERPTSPSILNITVLPSDGQVENENGSIFTESCDNGSISLSSEVLVDKPHTNMDYIESPALEEPISPNTSKNVSSIIQSDTENDPVISNLIDEVAEKLACESVTSVSIEAVHEQVGLNIDTTDSYEAVVCNIATCEDAKIGSDSEILCSDLLIHENVSEVKFESEIEHVEIQSTISNLTTRLSRTETIVDDSPETSESITCKAYTDVHDRNTDCYDSRNTFVPESQISDDSTNVGRNEVNNCLDPEEIDHEPFTADVSLVEDCSELKESNLPQLSLSGMISAIDTEISIDGGSLNEIVSDITICDSSIAVEHITPDDATEFEVYIASEPVTCCTALGFTIEVLPSSETPIDYHPDADNIEKMPDPITSDSQFGTCSKLSEHEGDYAQNSKTNLTPESIVRHIPTNADIGESSISKSPVSSLVRDEPTIGDESATDANLDSSVPRVSETIVCEVTKDDDIESDNAVGESTSPTSSTDIEDSLDSTQSAENIPGDVDEDSGMNVENKAWKKKHRKSKKKRKH